MNITRVRRMRGGFTLVELLVVIGIIAILVGVLLPVLSNARRSSANVKCLSNLRQLAYAFQMYAGANKDAFPLGRQDLPEVNGVPQNIYNLYWTDALYSYVLKNPAPTQYFTKQDALAYRKSALWCPTWEAEHPEIAPEVNYTDRFKNGYGYNIYFSFQSNYPSPDALPPVREVAIRSSALFATAPYGRYYRKSEMKDPANRLVVADSNLWIIGLGLTNAQGDLKGQHPYNNVALAHNDAPGGMNLDRFRHGKYPGVDGATSRYYTKGGQVAFNMMYADGHASSSNIVSEGYKAIRMRYP